MKRVVSMVLALLVLMGVALPSMPAHAEPTILCDEFDVPMSDGVRLYGYRNRYDTAPTPGPVIITMGPYGSGHSAPGSAGPPCSRPGDKGRAIDDELAGIFQHVIFHLRGSGASEGRWDLLGPRTQRDVDEVIDWVAAQPWSDGRILVEGNSGAGLFAPYAVQNPNVDLVIVHVLDELSPCPAVDAGGSRFPSVSVQ